MATSHASAHQRKGRAGRDCPAMACPAIGSKLYCAACSGTALKICAGCYAAHYCCRACQKKDWHRHRNDCLKVCVIVRVLSGAGKQFDNLPLRTSVEDLKALVLPWAFQQLASSPAAFQQQLSSSFQQLPEAHHINVFDIDLLYDGKMLDNPRATLADIGVTDGDELQSIGRIDEPPPLLSSSDYDD